MSSFEDRILLNLPPARHLVEVNNAYESYQDLCEKCEIIPLSEEDFIYLIANIMAAGRSLQEKAEFFFDIKDKRNLDEFQLPIIPTENPSIPYIIHKKPDVLIFFLLEFYINRIMIMICYEKDKV